MKDRHASSTDPVERSHRDSRRADNIAGYAFFGLCATVSVITLVTAEIAIATGLWIALLVFWFVTTLASNDTRIPHRFQILLYLCSVFSSWLLLAFVSSPNTGLMPILLVTAAAVGALVVALRWVFVVIALNCTVIFVHMWLGGVSQVNAIASAIFYLVIHVAVAFTAYSGIREAQLRQQLEQKNLELEAAGVLLEDTAASAERLRISRELHDLIGHQLTVLNLELEAAKHLDATNAQEHVERAGAVAKELLSDVRRTVGDLREAKQGNLKERFERLSGSVPSLAIHIDMDEDISTDDDVSATLVRAAQEIITNTIKHAEASRLTLSIRQIDGNVIFEAWNDGITPSEVSLGHGLTGLKERVERLGGHLRVSTRPYFTVRAEIPLHSEGDL
ncbi:sensor histidine kinase [Ancrocorticia populi]|uniref:sensor histidine kinase n=1 Tax=Ancrocorticia populi TaxID=2175228 RepID=UPI003F98E666